ncbi:MAG: NAD(+)--dinitrogen-reductase ADP-D-ribosyltransferase [Nitrosomonadales bacterium]|nr:NAD(+)--dinitrogen-reductase ADP-D-ribosyltransferase [Nitrosomonadales bacterium]
MSNEESDTTIASRGHSTNLVGIPTGLLASVSFNDYPIPLSISGTRESHRSLFERLNTLDDAAEAGKIFQDYMALVFGLDHEHEKNGRRRYHASYLRLLKDWGFDSNSPAAAVLKGWVESRFGLFPTFHKGPIRRFNSPQWIGYMEEKMSSRFNNNTIHMQFDLLYEFCQWVLVRFHAVGKKHLVLYRGTNDLSDQQLIQQLDKRTATVRLNNLVSFSSQREIADEFGDTIIEAEVPVPKIFFYNDLLPSHPLRGEAECLVLGGDYRVKMAYW